MAGATDPLCRDDAWCCLRLFMRNNLSELVQRALTGFAAGVMVAASIWSLLLPAMEQASDMERWSFVPAVAGFGSVSYSYWDWIG